MGLIDKPGEPIPQRSADDICPEITIRRGNLPTREHDGKRWGELVTQPDVVLRNKTASHVRAAAARGTKQGFGLHKPVFGKPLLFLREDNH